MLGLLTQSNKIKSKIQLLYHTYPQVTKKNYAQGFKRISDDFIKTSIKMAAWRSLSLLFKLQRRSAFGNQNEWQF